MQVLREIFEKSLAGSRISTNNANPFDLNQVLNQIFYSSTATVIMSLRRYAINGTLDNQRERETERKREESHSFSLCFSLFFPRLF